MWTSNRAERRELRITHSCGRSLMRNVFGERAEIHDLPIVGLAARSEHVFQCELQDPWVRRRQDLAEASAG